MSPTLYDTGSLSKTETAAALNCVWLHLLLGGILTLAAFPFISKTLLLLPRGHIYKLNCERMAHQK